MPLFVVHSRTGSKGVSLTQLGLGHLVVGGTSWQKMNGGTRRIQLQPGVGRLLAAVARMEMWQEHPKRKILRHLTNPGVGYLQIAWSSGFTDCSRALCFDPEPFPLASSFEALRVVPSRLANGHAAWLLLGWGNTSKGGQPP